MNPKEWNTYIDTGTVPTYFIQEIVQLIKNNQALNTKHLAVYQSHSPIIELKLKIKTNK